MTARRVLKKVGNKYMWFISSGANGSVPYGNKKFNKKSTARKYLKEVDKNN